MIGIESERGAPGGRGPGVLWVALAVVACGAPPIAPAPASAPAPAAPVPAAASPSTPRTTARRDGYLCPAPRPPEGTWRLQRGWASGATRAEALSAAERTARAELLRSMAASLSAVERREVEAAIDTTWAPPLVSASPGGGFEACVTAIVRAHAAGDRLKRLSDALDERLRDRARALAAALGPAPRLVRLTPPVWAGDRGAGALGASVLLRFRAALGEDVEVATSDAAGGATEVRAELGGDGGGCVLVVQYQRPGQHGFAALEPVRFEPLAVARAECAPPPDTFISDARMGLTQGRRRGDTGLTVRVSAPLHGGALCEGEPFSMTVEASERAWVRVYAVAEDGRALLGWASPRPITRWTPEDEAVALRLPGNARYRLVAVAVPAALGEAGFGRGLPPPGCMAGAGLDAGRLPGAGAAGTLEMEVTAPGLSGCPGDAATRALAEDLRAAVDALPRCGEHAARAPHRGGIGPLAAPRREGYACAEARLNAGAGIWHEGR